MRKVFKEGNYSRLETTLGNTVSVQIFNKNNIRLIKFFIRMLKTMQILNSVLQAKDLLIKMRTRTIVKLLLFVYEFL